MIEQKPITNVMTKPERDYQAGWNACATAARAHTEGLEAALQRQKDINQEMREAMEAFAGKVITVRQVNTPEWMEWLAEEVNAFCEGIGEIDRFRFDGDGLRRIGA